MENYIAAYKNNSLDAQDFKMLGDNIPDLHLDINQGFNPIYYNLYSALLGRNSKTNGNLRFFDSVNMRKVIEDRLASPYLEVLFYRFGIYDDKCYTLEETTKMIGKSGCTRERIRSLESKAIRLLKSPICARKLANVYDDSLIEVDSLTQEEQSRRTTLLDRIYGSNLIFIPDEEFAQLPDDISLSDFQEIASELCAIKESSSHRKSMEEINYEDLLDGAQGHTTDLEQLRNRKQKLEQELEKIRLQNKSAKKLLDRFDTLLNDAEHDNTKDTDIKGE